jgi:hypothetical protein
MFNKKFVAILLALELIVSIGYVVSQPSQMAKLGFVIEGSEEKEDGGSGLGSYIIKNPPVEASETIDESVEPVLPAQVEDEPVLPAQVEIPGIHHCKVTDIIIDAKGIMHFKIESDELPAPGFQILTLSANSETGVFLFSESGFSYTKSIWEPIADVLIEAFYHDRYVDITPHPADTNPSVVFIDAVRVVR